MSGSIESGSPDYRALLQTALFQAGDGRGEALRDLTSEVEKLGAAVNSVGTGRAKLVMSYEVVPAGRYCRLG